MELVLLNAQLEPSELTKSAQHVTAPAQLVTINHSTTVNHVLLDSSSMELLALINVDQANML
jgi:hypothetical protein